MRVGTGYWRGQAWAASPPGRTSTGDTASGTGQNTGTSIN